MVHRGGGVGGWRVAGAKKKKKTSRRQLLESPFLDRT